MSKRRVLLSGPKYEARDPARYAGRIGKELRKPVIDGSWTELLGLTGMRVTEYAVVPQGDQELLHVFCEHEHEVALCPRCRQLSARLHESEERCVRHLELWGKRIFVHFRARRFDCER